MTYMIREHPLKIFKHSKNSIWLLVFPILRGVRSFSIDIDAFYTWITGIGYDLLILAAILGFGFFRWLFTIIRYGNNHVRYTSGFFVKTTVNIPYKNIATVTECRSFYLRPFKAVRVHIDTGAGALKQTDLSILVSGDDFKPLKKKLSETNKKINFVLGKEERAIKYFRLKPKWQKIVFFSFIFSSSLSGAVYFSALIWQAGRIAADLMRSEITGVYEMANDVSENVTANTPIEIPPVVVVMVTIILATWLLSFFSNIFRYHDFEIKKYQRTNIMEISFGAFTKRICYIASNKINYLDLRQSLITKLCRISSLNINCSGYGKGSNELPVIMPILERNQIKSAAELLGFDILGNEKEWVKTDKKPENRAFMSYISIPLFFFCTIIGVSFIITKIFPQIAYMMIFITIILEIPFIWLIIVKINAFRTTGITIKGNICWIRYSRFYAYHTIIVDKSKLVKVQIFRDVIDRAFKNGVYRLDFYFESEKKRAHKVKGLSKDNVIYILGELGIDYYEFYK